MRFGNIYSIHYRKTSMSDRSESDEDDVFRSLSPMSVSNIQDEGDKEGGVTFMRVRIMKRRRKKIMMSLLIFQIYHRKPNWTRNPNFLLRQ
jgi:hypothetical protein